MSIESELHPTTRARDESSTNGPAEISDLCAEKVTTKPIEWLWHGRIPSGKLTIFDGDPDLIVLVVLGVFDGKSRSGGNSAAATAVCLRTRR